VPQREGKSGSWNRDETPTQRHRVRGDVSEETTLHTGRLVEGEEEDSEGARADRGGGENEKEEWRGQEADEENL